MNTFSLIFLTVLLTGAAIQYLLLVRQLSYVGRHRDKVPEQFREKVTPAEHEKAADYTRAKARVGMVDVFAGAVVLLTWTLGGGLAMLDRTWRSLDLATLWTGVGFMLSVILITSLIDAPVSLYRTFVLEEKFGFNKMTPKIFILDSIKNLALTLVIGTPLLALILLLMSNAGSFWWFYVWLTWFGFSLFIMWFYPAFIAPLFNRFRPLDDQTLKTRIEDLLKRNGFTSQGILVMDGSARSTHGNAYFTGMGGNKRIVFFDTLINELTHEEIEAVLAHELGHFKRNHVKKRIAVLAVILLAGFGVLGWLIDKTWFYAGLGVSVESTYMALTLFMMVTPVFGLFFQPVFSWYSRQHEFEADDFAADQAQARNLIQALVKLYKENASTLTPDPVYSAFHDSHPPAPIRIRQLEAR